jgi:hypothetical protein
VDTEVRKGRQALLVNGVPETEFGGDAIVEPVEQRQAVAPFWRRGEAEQLGGLNSL